MFSIVDTLPRDQVPDEGFCPLLTRVLSPDLLTAAAAAATPPGARERKLSPRRLVLFVIAMTLYSDAAMASVAERLWFGLGWVCLPGSGAVPPSKGAISQGRARLGVAAIRGLFRRQCRPRATATTHGAFYAGLRIMAIDTTFEAVPDTPANARVFGRRQSRFGPAPFPLVMGTYLLECATHLFVDAVFGPCHGDPHAAARRLLRSVDPTMLLLWDRGFHSLTLLRTCLDDGIAFLGRVGSQVQYPVWQSLSDGSYLAHVTGAPRPPGTPLPVAQLVRVMVYTLTDPTRPGVGEHHRLVTGLLDPVACPAQELIVLYHERWEFEVALDEIDTHLRPPGRPLRSQTPRGVIQELYGVLLAHYVLRAIMLEVADRADLDPDQVSFVRTRTLVLTVLPLFPFLPPSVRDVVWDGLLQALATRPLPPREDRTNPRAVKRPVSKYRKKQPGTRCAPPHPVSFLDAICVLTPPLIQLPLLI
jgi:hypothetical protein